MIVQGRGSRCRRRTLAADSIETGSALEQFGTEPRQACTAATGWQGCFGDQAIAGSAASAS